VFETQTVGSQNLQFVIVKIAKLGLKKVDLPGLCPMDLVKIGGAAKRIHNEKMGTISTKKML